MIKVIYGDEPFFILKHKALLVEHIQAQEMNVSHYEGEFTEDVFNMCSQTPFLSDRRVVFLDTDTLKGLDNKLFSEYLEGKGVSSTDLCVIVREVDKRLKVFKALEGKKVLTEYSKLKDKESLVNEILLMLKKDSARIMPAAMNEFVRRINYFEVPETNLCMVEGYLQTMAAMTKDITEDVVKEVVPVFELPKIFDFARLIRDDNIEELLHQLNLLDSKEAIKIMSLLMREIRIAIKCKHFSAAQIGLRSDAVFSGCGEEALLSALQIVTDTIDGIKTGRFTDGIGLKYAFAAVTDVLAA